MVLEPWWSSSRGGGGGLGRAQLGAARRGAVARVEPGADQPGLILGRSGVLGPSGQIRIPNWPMPRLMSNHGNYIVSMGNVCRWLAEQAEALEVEIFPGMACSQLVYEGERVVGVVAGENRFEDFDTCFRVPRFWCGDVMWIGFCRR